MTFTSIVRNIGKSPLTDELLQKLQQKGSLSLTGISRLPKGLIATALAQAQAHNLLVVCATIEEASRWEARL